MPNYRNKNKNRKKQNRNKSNNNNNNQNKNQQEANPPPNGQKVQDEELREQVRPETGNVSNKPAAVAASPPPTADEDDGNNLTSSSAAAAPTDSTSAPTQSADSDALNAAETVDEKSEKVNAKAVPSHADDILVAGTVSHGSATHTELIEQSTQQQQARRYKDDDPQSASSSAIEMGAKSSKIVHTLDVADDVSLTESACREALEGQTTATTTPVNTKQGKVIIHRVIQEAPAAKEPATNADKAKVIIHRIVQQTEADAYEEPAAEETLILPEQPSNALQNAKVIIHPISLETSYQQQQPMGKQDLCEITNYDIESPKSIVSPVSILNDENRIQIQEVSDESSGEYDNPPLVSEAESEPETPTIVYTATSSNVISIQTLPLSAATQKDSGKAAEDLKQRQAQKRIALETHFLPQLLSPRYLDSITEENSDMSDARSDCSDHPSTHTSAPIECVSALDNEAKAKKANAIFPKSNLDFSRKHKHGSLPKVPTMPGAIREEPVAMMVEAKLVEQMSAAQESCTTLSSVQTPESEAAEVVYINSASSSISDLLELDAEDEKLAQSRTTVDLDIDVQELITKPLEAVASRESTPVNQLSPLLETAIPTINRNSVLEATISRSDCGVGERRQSGIVESVQSAERDERSFASSSLEMLSAGGVDEARKTISLESCEADWRSGATSETKILPPSDSNRLRAEQIAEPIKLLASSEMNNVREIVNSYKTEFSAQNVASSEFNNDFCRKQDHDHAKASAQTAPNASAFSYSANNEDKHDAGIKKLRLLCAETLASMPYGEEVLEELATVAQNIGEVRASNSIPNKEKMPYPLPDLPHINDLQLSLTADADVTRTTHYNEKLRSPPPPPVPEPPSKYDSWLGLPTDSDPKLLVCLSPSQRSYIDEQQQPKANNKPDNLLDAHQKFIERRGYHEYTMDQVKAMDSEQFKEQQILQTAAIMKKLRKSLTPPPVPPPPVPSKSSKTVAKAQSQNQTKTKAASDHDASVRNANEQSAAPLLAVDGEENKHRLLTIIHGDTNECEQSQTAVKTSSLENSSRQFAQKQGEPAAQVQSATESAGRWTEPAKTAISSGISNERTEHTIVSSSKTSSSSTADKSQTTLPTTESDDTDNIKMQSVESELAKMFPAMGHTNIFDAHKKRFSNIESSTNNPYCSQLLSTQPKRYSSIETSSYESKKRIDNGQVVYDISNSQRASETDGDKSLTQWPTSDSAAPQHSATKDNSGDASSSADVREIMSALKLNTENSTAKTTNTAEQHENNSHSKLSEESHESRARIINRQQSDNTTTSSRGFGGSGSGGTYEEFRQRAKAAAEAVQAPASVPVGSNEHKSSSHFDHEKLFKDFDDLSKQLHKELESGKAQKEQREKSSSLYDLSRMQWQYKDHFDDMKKQRHEHLQELEREIDRSMRSRQTRTVTQPQAVPRTYEIPIKIERDSAQGVSRTHRIPVQMEAPYQVTTPVTPQNMDYVDNSRYRRAESMFNLSDNGAQAPRQRSSSINYGDASTTDDWSRYASDLGSSENIARPFAREVEICYQRMQPKTIRAPRLTSSTNDLSLNQHTFDNYNAFNVRRTHAPMLSQVPQKNRPQYLSCHSMLERDPNPTYISTTSRRGVSPAPATSPVPPTEPQSNFRSLPELPNRRASLPHELHERQLNFILSKEEELKTEFERLQNERRRLVDEMQRAQTVQMPQRPLRHDMYRPPPRLPTLSEDEVFRQQMAEEWLNKVAEREERRLQKIIKISKVHEEGEHQIPVQHQSAKPGISEEFLDRVKERRSKLAMPADSDWESGAESYPMGQGQASESEDLPPIKVIEGKSEADLRHLPRHLREFAKFSNHQREKLDNGHREVHQEEESRKEADDNSMSSAVKKSSVVKTVKISRCPLIGGNDNATSSAAGQVIGPSVHRVKPMDGQRAAKHHSKDQLPPLAQSSARLHRKKDRLDSAATAIPGHDQPVTLRNAKECKKTRFLLTPNSRRSWSESDLLQEIDSELKMAKGFLFADVYKVKHEYMSEPETEYDRPKKMAQLGRLKFDGIGPVTNDGMPINLRSEVKEPHQHEWYKRLYQTIHKQKNGDDYVIRYKCPRGRHQYKTTGYQSEPEPNYDSDYSTVKYRTLDRRRLQSVSSAANVRSGANFSQDDKLYGTMPNAVKSGQNLYKNQPGRIEDYVTGKSSVSDKEKKEWWDEVMDIFNGHLEQTKLSPHYTEGYLSRALAKESSGYTSDSNLVFRKKEAPPSSALSPVEQKQAYKSLQAGGEPPLFGFRKPAPEKPKESPNRYYESDVNIHFRTPIRNEYKASISEEELAQRQAEQMQKLYQEERRRKYLQELQDMNSRRHTDNFTQSQKSPIPLNRYDDFQSDLAPKSPNLATYPKAVARALYNFQGQSARELSFRKGDVIYIRRQIDSNWYEGEHNASIGLLPVNYVEIINKDGIRQPARKPSEGQARAKFNFQAQSGVELSLNKGELITLTRRVDDNWFEGKIANRKGIFPVSYVEVLTDIGAEDIASKTVITEHSTTNLRPSLDTLRTNINNEFNTLTQNGHQPPNGILKETKNLHKTDILHVDTSTEPLAYRALYKYRPQNSDELELLEGDIVHVLEKCDDGWFVGTSQRTGCFGTFPGNYVERA